MFLLPSKTTALFAAAVPFVIPSIFSKSVSSMSAEPIIKEEPEVTDPVEVIAPEPTVPARVTLAPEKVAAVVEPDFTIRLAPLEVRLPYCVPASSSITSPPSASILISPGASNVTSVPPFSTKSSTVVPADFIVILLPAASRLISVAASSVIAASESISSIFGVVKVLFVSVSVVALPTKVSVASGKVNVLSAPRDATPARVILLVPFAVPSLN